MPNDGDWEFPDDARPKQGELGFDLEGDLDLRGFLGISPDVRSGYSNVRVTCHIEADAPREQIADAPPPYLANLSVAAYLLEELTTGNIASPPTLPPPYSKLNNP